MADNVEMDPNHPAALALGEIAPELVELPQQEPEQQQLTLADIQIALATMSTTQVELQQVLGHFMTTSKTQLEANAKKSSSTSVRVKEPRVFDGRASELCQDLTIIFSLFLFFSTSAFGHRSSAHYIIRLNYLNHDHYLS